VDEVRLLRISEVAELLKISRTKVYELVAKGEIPSLHLGRSRRVPLRALRDWIIAETERAAPAAPPPPFVDPAPRSRRTIPKPAPPPASRARRARAQREPPDVETVPDEPFFRPWMPRPMRKKAYQLWVAHLEAHPDEKALVIEAMERYDASRRTGRWSTVAHLGNRSIK
jgi:excisionase family DNA binding protein